MDLLKKPNRMEFLDKRSDGIQRIRMIFGLRWIESRHLFSIFPFTEQFTGIEKQLVLQSLQKIIVNAFRNQIPLFTPLKMDYCSYSLSDLEFREYLGYFGL